MNRGVFARLRNVYNIKFKHKQITTNAYKLVAIAGINILLKELCGEIPVLYDQGIKYSYTIKLTYGKF